MAVAVAVVVAVAAFGAGCVSTLTPPLVRPTAPTADGGRYDSGFRGFDDLGNGVISTNLAAKYEALRVIYGGRETPPVMAGAGLSAGPSNGVVRIDPEHLDKLKVWVFWHNNGK